MPVGEYPSLSAAVEDLFPGDKLAGRAPGGGGGCINSVSKIILKSGKVLFLKENDRAPSSMFREEARGLQSLNDAFPLKVPAPLALGREKASSFLLLEYVMSGSKGSGFWGRFGRALAQMHRQGKGESFGYDSDNFIGSTPQINDRMSRWTDFFAEKRLMFQIELARSSRLADSSMSRGVLSICRRIGDLLPEPDYPSLLHGDLWSGNFMVDDRGEAVLIDPAVYYGHREADLAMTELFGGYNREFYRAYEEEFPLVPGYGERRDLYNLYHMLNHLNLFGSSYSGSVRSIISRYS
ncbi:fructosamine kinase family protein [Spirochaeta isovalerica]|uniref:Fructosamine-3-kinase n=1 Tax=Spirochaeta isovalerica TaxID=150 RepID=A0A841RFP7_9SPIO|nr:fructosamine kinase family protein [Spirochaeta isovalerica]MBB6481629.1 fructosamine-3-kinase [Spirochaeta isovalerica]